MPTDVGAAADLAQTVAIAQRWWATAGNFVDHLAVRWLIELLGVPAGYVGRLTSGGSTANLIGIGSARQHAGERLGLNPSLDGIGGMVEPRVYASETTHHVVSRALGVLGMGRRNLRAIPLDDRGTIDLQRLQQALAEDETAGCTQVAIVGSAGDANMGLIDPLPELAAIARERGIWFHVDGAYGGFGLLDPRIRDRYGDVAHYDSFAVDPHKWMAAPVGTGAIFVRDEGVLARAFTIETGAYDSEREAERGVDDTGSPFDELGEGTPDWGVDFSTPARGVAVWAILNEIGAQGMKDRVMRHNDCARRVANRVQASSELELLAEPTLSICCFRYRPPELTAEEVDDFNETLLHELRAGGGYVTSSTTVNGAFALRPCFINPRSTISDADGLVDEVIAIGRRLSQTRCIEVRGV
jgi:glutamate/tyrosine decarboxylase-like PLP-dependent enzyme